MPKLTYYLYRHRDGQVPETWLGNDDDVRAVRDAFATWSALKLGIAFAEVDRAEDATIRISFDRSERRSWSLVGTDNRSRKEASVPTMNFGWPLTDDYGFDTALHEIGHALGLEHEHQNPHSGIQWNEEAVLAYFRGERNKWKDEETRWNVLRKLSPAEIKGTTWDPDSIMEYWFEAGLIDQPEKYRSGLKPAGGLSSADIEWTEASYPDRRFEGALPQLTVGELMRMDLGRGETRTFAFWPEATATYQICTAGSSDSTLVLFETTPHGNVQIAADEDRGEDRNAQITVDLHAGKKYEIGVRLHYAPDASQVEVRVWQ